MKNTSRSFKKARFPLSLISLFLLSCSLVIPSSQGEDDKNVTSGEAKQENATKESSSSLKEAAIKAGEKAVDITADVAGRLREGIHAATAPQKNDKDEKDKHKADDADKEDESSRDKKDDTTHHKYDDNKKKVKKEKRVEKESTEKEE